MRYLVGRLRRPIDRAAAVLLCAGLALGGFSYAIVVAASESTVVKVEGDLDRYWQTTYDLLVRPPDAIGEVEARWNLVRPNHLSTLPGKISIDQYERIRRIPGVEVAAPIAMVGYVTVTVEEEMFPPDRPGLYTLRETMLSSDGVREYTREQRSFMLAEYLGTSRSGKEDLHFMLRYGMARWPLARSPDVSPKIPLPVALAFPLAAVDPEAENELVGLGRAVVTGRYLTCSEGASRRSALSDLPGGTAWAIPVLLNARCYVDATVTWELLPVEADTSPAGLEEIARRGGREYLLTLPVGPAERVVRANLEDLYRLFLEQCRTFPDPGRGKPVSMPGAFGPLYRLPSPVGYDEETARAEALRPILRAEPVGVANGQVVFRQPPVPVQPRVVVYPDVVGVIDIDLLQPGGTPLNPVPLETYFPPAARAVAAPGRGSASRGWLKPTLEPAGYLQLPAVLITTLEAARQLVGDDCISAVRVRVKGARERSPETQRRLEVVASEIARVTGLHVDITAGSSPRRVNVYLPGYGDVEGVGWIEEPWVQKGLHLDVSRRVQGDSVMLSSVMLLAAGVFALHMSRLNLHRRRRELSLLLALGWRWRTVALYTFLELLFVGMVAAGVSLPVALVVSRPLGLRIPPGKALLAGPVTVALALVAGLLVFAELRRITPWEGVAAAGYSSSPVGRAGFSFLGYAWYSLRRRRGHLVPVGVLMALGSGVLVLLQMLLRGTAGYLEMTLLGEYILVGVRPYHQVIAGVSYLVAGLAVSYSTMVEANARQAEVALLRA
ncbi:MAG: FtsX-like permease family protein, partial [Bacillota bacterium]